MTDALIKISIFNAAIYGLGFTLLSLVHLYDPIAEGWTRWAWLGRDPYEYDQECMPEDVIRDRHRALVQRARDTEETTTHVVRDPGHLFLSGGLHMRAYPIRYPETRETPIIMTHDAGNLLEVHRTLEVCEPGGSAEIAFASTSWGTTGWSTMSYERRDEETGSVRWVTVYLEPETVAAN